MTTQSNTKLYTRGGQTLINAFTMFKQVTSKVVLAGFSTFAILLSLLIVNTTDAYDRYVGRQWLSASVLAGINPHRDKKIDWILPNGAFVQVYQSNVLSSIEVQNRLYHLRLALMKSGVTAGCFSLIALFCLTQLLYKRGKKHNDAKVIRGQILADKKTLIRIIKKGQISPYSIASIPLPRNAETQHIQFVGTTGAGKTVAIRELLQVIRARGERAIIYDKGGTYISKYYQEGRDVILNPLDARGFAWDVWQECEDKADFEAIAEALMPMPATASIDPFWVNAARMIFVSTANELRKAPNRSNLLLLQYLLTKNMGEIFGLIKHTELGSLVSDKVEKTALNVKAVMATYLKSLTYLKTRGEFFSIRNWIANDDHSKDFLFISSNERKHPTLRPLISAWLNTATRELLSIRPKENRRIWFILDELATLHQLPYLELVMSESRKFGGCFVLGYHGVSQLRKIYGSDGASNLSNFCSTQIFMRLIDSVNSQWASESLGTCEIEEFNESISYGANTIRDGISLSKTVKEKKVALPSEIAMLDDLEAFIKMKGNLPCTKATFDYVDYKDLNPDFVEREGEKDALASEVDKLINKFEAKHISDAHDKLLEEDSNTEKLKNNPKSVLTQDDKELISYL